MKHIDFRLMSLAFKIRDFFTPPGVFLKETSVRTGYQILDYGCGPGSYSIEAARMVGPSGKIFSVDINPLAVDTVQEKAIKNGLKNIVTILTDCTLSLADESVDVVLLYDTFHDLVNPSGVLKELHRVLKTGSLLSFSDHHMKETEILGKLTETSLFEFQGKAQKTYRFIRA